MRVVVTGAAGQLGVVIARSFEEEHDVRRLTRDDLDLADTAGIEPWIGSERPDVLINCAAHNLVDQSEEDALPALTVNALAVRALARGCASVGATLVHYSTDFVFDGTADRAYTEGDAPNPRSAYAMSKLLGEWFARDPAKHYVLRVESLFGGARRRSSTDLIVDGLLAGREVPVFVDRTVSPSYVVDVAAATRALLREGAPPGLYHCVNSGSTTWEHLALEAARMLGVPARLRGLRAADTPMRAQRPIFCALSNAKLAGLGIAMPAWQDALGRYLRERADQR